MLKCFFAVVLNCSLLCLPAYAEEAPLIPREILFGNPEKSAAAISPDGKLLAYLAPDQNDALNVWIQNSQPDNCAPRLITSDKKRGIRAFRWAFDSKSILYIQDRDGDENWHIYQTDLATKSTRDLTPFEGASASILAYERQYPNEGLIQLNVRDRSVFDVYRLNLTDGTATLEVENRGNFKEWVADHNLQVRAGSAYDKNGETVIYVRDDNSAPWREALRWGVEDEGRLVGFSPDNSALYLITSIGSQTERLVQLDLIYGTLTTIAEDGLYDLSTTLTNPNTHVIEAVGVDRDRFEWILLDQGLKADFDFLGINQNKEEIRVMSRDTSDQQWIVGYISDLHAAHYYLYDRASKSKRFLFSAKPELDKYPLCKMRPLSILARDGMELHVYLTLPEQAKRNLPAVLLVHGGPWSRDKWGLNSLVQWLANRGYVVMQVNFRGSTGYGKDYLNAGNCEWAGKMQTDLLDAKAWMVNEGLVDPNKVAIFGGSYGGYAALVGLTFTPEEFCCGVDLVGPSNIVTLLQNMPPYWNPIKTMFDLRIGTDKEYLESISPLFKADKIVRPLLIAQGANDPRVKQGESDQIVEAMRQSGKEVEYLLLPDEGHGFARPTNMLLFTAMGEEFLHKHLGGRLEPK